MTALWQGKAIEKLTDKEVFDAVAVIRTTVANYNEKQKQLTVNAQIDGHRHSMFRTTPLPPMNPIFLNLQNALEAELKIRTGVK